MKGQSVACCSITSADSNNIVETLDNVVYDFGAPEHFSFDGHMSQVGRKTRFRKSLCKYNVDFHVSGPRRPNEDPDPGTEEDILSRYVQECDFHVPLGFSSRMVM